MAEKFEERHDDVLKAIRNLKCLENFRLQNFVESSYQADASYQAESSYQNEQKKDQLIFLISRDGFSFLAMGFTGKKAAEWRERYIEAFRRMEKTIIKLVHQRERQLTLEWKQVREDSKLSRRATTDAIQEFCELAKSQGSRHSQFYYKSITELIYDAVVIPGGHKEIAQRKKELKKSNGREVMTLEELVKVELMERLVVRKALKEALEGNKFYKDIYSIVKEDLLRYGEIVEKRLFLEMNNQQMNNQQMNNRQRIAVNQ